jgi:hypothetical protein
LSNQLERGLPNGPMIDLFCECEVPAPGSA